ncbi:MAG: acyl--CoA ligase [Gammaproteobacteria bacterium]|nr:acyl--CoA ligase [Gammaproteobacteria bacterium]
MNIFPTVDSFISYWARETPHRKAVVCDRTNEEISYSDLESLVNYLCALYSDRVPPRSKCALYLDDTIVCHALLHAIFKLGGIAIPLDSELGQTTQLNMLRHAQADVIFMGSDNIHVEFISDEVDTATLVFSNSLCSHQPIGGEANSFLSLSKDSEVAMIAYTSGTTSDSKGVILTHRNLVSAYESAAIHLCAPKVVGCVFRMATLGTLGIHFFYAQYCGATTVLLPKLTVFNANEFWDSHIRHQIDFIYLVPSLLKMMTHISCAPKSKLKGIVVSAGSHLPKVEQDKFQDKFNITVRNIYGLTESSFAVFFGREVSGRGTNDIGPACSLRARVVDDNGNDLPNGCIGELWYEGEMVSQGYFENEVDTKSTFNEGWLATGDLVTRDDKGNFTITGRKKDIIIRGGFNIYPIEIEEAIEFEENVIDAFIMGGENSVMGEEILAYVQVDNATQVNQSEITKRVRKRVGTFKTPDRFIFSTRNVPLNAAGKVDRKQLMNWFREGLK